MTDAWSLLEAAPCGAAMFDEDGRVVAVNPVAEAIFGRAGADVVGHDVDALLTEPEPLAAVLQEGARRELRIVSADGAARIVEVSAARSPVGEPRRRVLFFRDLTAERAMAKELAHRKAVAATVRDAVIETDTEFRIVDWNRAAETLYGWSAEEVVGRSTVELLRTELSESDTQRMLGDLAEQGHVLTLARQYTRANTVVEVEASVIALHDGDGALAGYLAVNRDIGRRRRLEERLQATRHLEVVGRLAGGIAHDLNSLLTAILGYADLILADREVPARTRPDLQQVVVAAERAGELTRQLLAFSRQQVLDPQRLDVNEVIEGTRAARRRLTGGTVELLDLPASDAAPVMADRARLEQTLLDVVTNAGEAMSGGGRVVTGARTVVLEGSATAPAGAYVCLTVADDGTGMDATTLARAVEPFFTTKRGHTGLGLSTAYGFMGQSGGHLVLQAEPGSGTTVELYLPLAG